MNIKKEILLPKDVQFIIKTLESKGFEAYIVGGCVRDILLNTKPKDYDITTNAFPEHIMKIFNKVIPTGIKHGTVTVCLNDERYEVTTFRSDGEYKDGRHPESVQFIQNLYEDLKRRDFTINALAYNPNCGLIDYFNGVEDLKKNIITAVGDPDKRFKEDALRMMRAIRFSAQLNFKIEDCTLAAIKKMKIEIKKVSMERIREEFNKIILYNPDKLYLLKECNILEIIIKDIEKAYDFKQNTKYHKYNLFDHSVIAMKNVKPLLHLRLTMMFHDFGKIDTKITDENGVSHYYKHEIYSEKRAVKILKELKYDNRTINKVSLLIKYHDYSFENKVAVKKILNILGKETFNDLIEVKKADLSGKDLTICKGGMEKIHKVEEYLKDVLDNKECYLKKDLQVNGNDLKKIGINGARIGKVLDILLAKVIDDNKLNEKNILLDIVKKIDKI